MKKQTPFGSPEALVTRKAADRFGLTGIQVWGGGRVGQWRWALLVMGVLGSFLADASVQGADPSDTFYGTGALANVTTGTNDSAFGYFALNQNTSGNDNTASGAYALYYNESGNDNTASGKYALYYNTIGSDNTASGNYALYYNTFGNGNTANGSFALLYNTGYSNTATGDGALQANTTGNSNTANGATALLSNTTGSSNTASGIEALFLNTTGSDNVATGYQALFSNTTGDDNIASGMWALNSNTTGNNNIASGYQALLNNTTGSNNIAVGNSAGYSMTIGNNNIALGNSAGYNLFNGNNNIDIGNKGVTHESNTIRIGTTGTQTATFIAGIRETPLAQGVAVAVGITADGQLGVRASSERFKEAIKPMDKTSEAIFSLQPVTFRYKKALDPQALPQFGLVAEQVAKVDPDLVVSDENGKPFTVRYEEVNAMLLNEFLKEHRKVEEQTEINQRQEATIARQEQDFQAAIAQQQKEIRALTVALKAQVVQIQKVSDQRRTQAVAPRVVTSN